jgi:site-specific recombinase XerD
VTPRPPAALGPADATLPVVLPADAALAVFDGWGAHPDRHPALVYLAGRAASSRRPLRQALDVVAATLTGGRADHRTLPWHLLRYQHTAAVRSALAEQYEPAGARLKLAALRGVLKEAWRLGYLDAESYHRAVDVAPVRGSTDVPAGRELTPGEIRALLEACASDPSPAGVRDAAVVALLYGAGLRRAEAVRLDVSDLVVDGPDAGTLAVLGKGNKRALAYARGASLDVLRAWLLRRNSGPNASDAGRLLLPVSQTGVVVHTRQLPGRPVAPAGLSEYAVYLRLKVRAVEAGVRPFSPHDCRRTFAGDLLDAGADLNTVKELLRHASVATTAKYDRRGERAKRSAADLLRFPHVRF